MTRAGDSRPATLSLEQARRLTLRAQLLDGRGRPPRGKEGVARTIEHLGYVQIDTISVVQRAHHHTLWNRRADYDPTMLHALQATDRRVFEYWGHAASYLPLSDYRFYLPKMQSFQTPSSRWERDRLEKHGHLMKPVLERIREEGPLSSKDFKAPPDTKRGTWWDWNIRVVVPVVLSALFVWSLYDTVTREGGYLYDKSGQLLVPTMVGLILAGLAPLLSVLLSFVRSPHSEADAVHAAEPVAPAETPERIGGGLALLAGVGVTAVVACTIRLVLVVRAGCG